MLRTKSILFHDDIFSKTKEGIIVVGIILVVMILVGIIMVGIILVGIIMVGNVIVGYGRYYCYIDPAFILQNKDKIKLNIK